jgi:SAM-dependent methyltransferase
MATATRIGDNQYGDLYAADYDSLFGDRDDLDLVCALLNELAGDGDVIEFGVGTGRLAIPLAARGRRVYGVDNSPKMLSALAAKPGAERVVPVLGDFVDIKVEAKASLVFSAFSSIYLVGTQDAQVNTVRNAAAHLPVGGKFLIETFVHDRTRLTNDQEVVITRLEERAVGLRLGIYDPATQMIRTQKVSLDADGRVSFLPNRLRVIPPAELDLMARLAGMRLQSRWSDWERHPFDASSTNQIAVYEKVADHAI